MSEPRSLPAGTIRRIYIDPSELGDPDGKPIRILEGEVRNPIPASQVEVEGFCTIKFDSKRPLWSSARVWIETDSKLSIQ